MVARRRWGAPCSSPYECFLKFSQTTTNIDVIIITTIDYKHTLCFRSSSTMKLSHWSFYNHFIYGWLLILLVWRWQKPVCLRHCRCDLWPPLAFVVSFPLRPFLCKKMSSTTKLWGFWAYWTSFYTLDCSELVLPLPLFFYTINAYSYQRIPLSWSHLLPTWLSWSHLLPRWLFTYAGSPQAKVTFLKSPLTKVTFLKSPLTKVTFHVRFTSTSVHIENRIKKQVTNH